VFKKRRKIFKTPKMKILIISSLIDISIIELVRYMHKESKLHDYDYMVVIEKSFFKPNVITTAIFNKKELDKKFGISTELH
jgi:hypothetical protein